MLNIARLVVGAIALLTPLVIPLSMTAPAYADRDRDDETPELDFGICGVGGYYYSGLSVVDSRGQLVDVEAYCRSRSLSPDTLQNMPTEERDVAFWQAFLVAASPTALNFANAAGREKVVEYGQTICPFLQADNSMDELRATQAEGRTPPSFEAAVTVAAINTYCPNYRSELGRY